jgi:hypothetical protein
VTGFRDEPFKVDQLSSWAEDAAGELYAISQGGSIVKLGS